MAVMLLLVAVAIVVAFALFRKAILDAPLGDPSSSSAPSLTILRTEPSSRSVKVFWSLNAQSAVFRAYSLAYRSVADTAFTEHDGFTIASTTTSVFPNLEGGTEYEFRVSAIFDGEIDDAVATVRATTLGPTTLPPNLAEKWAQKHAVSLVRRKVVCNATDVFSSHGPEITYNIDSRQYEFGDDAVHLWDETPTTYCAREYGLFLNCIANGSFTVLQWVLTGVGGCETCVPFTPDYDKGFVVTWLEYYILDADYNEQVHEIIPPAGVQGSQLVFHFVPHPEIRRYQFNLTLELPNGKQVQTGFTEQTSPEFTLTMTCDNEIDGEMNRITVSPKLNPETTHPINGTLTIIPVYSTAPPSEIDIVSLDPVTVDMPVYDRYRVELQVSPFDTIVRWLGAPKKLLFDTVDTQKFHTVVQIQTTLKRPDDDPESDEEGTYPNEMLTYVYLVLRLATTSGFHAEKHVAVLDIDLLPTRTEWNLDTSLLQDVTKDLTLTLGYDHYKDEGNGEQTLQHTLVCDTRTVDALDLTPHTHLLTDATVDTTGVHYHRYTISIRTKETLLVDSWRWLNAFDINDHPSTIYAKITNYNPDIDTWQGIYQTTNDTPLLTSLSFAAESNTVQVRQAVV
jgi:hypothetical protein